MLQSSQEIGSLLLPTEEEMRLPYVFTLTFISDESDLIIDKLTTNLRTGAVIRLREEAAEFHPFREIDEKKKKAFYKFMDSKIDNCKSIR